MLTFIKIAWRDLWRHRLRSGLTLAAVIFGSALTLFFMAWARGAHQTMIQTAVGFFPGYLQVHRAGYMQDQSIARSMSLTKELAGYLDSSPLVSAYSPRLCTETLAQAGNNIAGTKICGVMPEKEKYVSRVAQTFFPEMIKTPKGIKTRRRYSGQFLSGNDPGAALLGADLAQNLQVEIGDQVSILTQDFYGSMAARNFKVKGIFKAGSLEYDAGLMLVSLVDLQDLLYLPGQITHLVIMAKNDRAIPELEKKIYLRLAAEQGSWKVEKVSDQGIWQIEPNRPNLPPGSPLQLADQQITLESIQRIPGLKGYSLRLNSGLLLNNRKISISGIVPENENSISGLFTGKSAKGKTEFSNQDWIAICSIVANKLGLKPGDQVVLSGSNYLGENFELKLRLAEIFEPAGPGPEAYASLGLLQEKLGAGENINQAAILLSGCIPLEQARGLIYSRLNYEAIPWQELAPDLAQNIELDNVSATLWLAILFIVIAFVFLLTIMMSVLERARQFGIMKAIGTRPAEVFLIIFYESVFLGLLGNLLGLILGAIPSLYFTFIPLNLASFGESMGDYMEQMGFDPYIYAKLEPAMFLYTSIIIFSFVLVMTIPPAIKASRTKPVQTLRLQ